MTNVTVPLAGLVDTVMLGHLDDIRFLAGVALGAVVFDYLYWTFGFLRMGTTGLTAQAMGRQRPDDGEIGDILLRSVVVALLFAGLIVVFQRPLADLSFAFLAGEPGVEAAGLDYYQARIWGAPAVLVNFVFLGWFLGREESRVALVMTVVASVANIVLDYLFIMHWQMAAYGAGLATMASQYLMLAVAVFFYLRRRKPSSGRWRRIFDRGALVALLRLQVDILVRTLCLVTAFAVFTNVSALMGTIVLAANAILLRLAAFAAFFIDGAAYATETLAGIFIGGGRTEELRHLLRLAMVTGCLFGGLFALVLLVAPGPILEPLTSHTEVVELAKTYSPWLAATLLFAAGAFILDGFFLGLTAGRTLRNAMIISILTFLPVAGVAWRLESPTLLWLGFVGFMAVRLVTLGRPAMKQFSATPADLRPSP